MKIAETDIKIFRAKQLKVEFQPPPTVVDVEMFEGALTPSENDTDTPLSSIKVEVYFRGESRDEIRRNVSRFCALLQKGTPLTLDGYRDRFMAYMTSNTTTKTITGKRYRAEFVVFQIKRAANLQIILAPYKIDVVLQPHYPETLLHITRTKILPCKLIAQEYSVSSYENGSSSSSIWQA